jgi:hypothetical protein
VVAQVRASSFSFAAATLICCKSLGSPLLLPHLFATLVFKIQARYFMLPHLSAASTSLLLSRSERAEGLYLQQTSEAAQTSYAAA